MIDSSTQEIVRLLRAGVESVLVTIQNIESQECVDMEDVDALDTDIKLLGRALTQAEYLVEDE